ncbi:MAG: FixG Ig-like domain-containing protein, partial [Chloroflexota bacterium]
MSASDRPNHPNRPDLALSQTVFAAEAGGPPLAATLVVHNRSEVVEQFSLAVEGLDPDWYELAPPSLSLFPGEQAEARLLVHPPDAAAGGRYPFHVVATPSTANTSAPSSATAGSTTSVTASQSPATPAMAATVAATLEIATVDAAELTLAPSRQRARREATYTVRLANHGNAAHSFRLLAADPAEALRYRCEPEDVTVPAGGEATARLHVRARHTALTGPARAFPFTVTVARSEDSLATPLAEAAGELVRAPLVPFLAALPVAGRQAAVLAIPILALLAVAAWIMGAMGTQLP